MPLDTDPRPRRLHWGCGPNATPGWINADLHALPGVDLVGDIRDGLPLTDGAVDAIVAIHVLQDLAWPDIAPALRELRRVLAPGGTLRLGLPDLDRAIDAYRRNDTDWFHVPDADARSAGAKLVTQIIWYGSVRTPMTWEAVNEWLLAAGFTSVRRCRFGETFSGDMALVGFDNRERESLFVEARR